MAASWANFPQLGKRKDALTLKLFKQWGSFTVQYFLTSKHQHKPIYNNKTSMLGRRFAKMSASTQAKSRAQGIHVHVDILPWNNLQIQLTQLLVFA